jgi:hypothetical protein
MEKQSEPKNIGEQHVDEMDKEKQAELDPNKLPANLRKFHGCFEDAPKSYSTKEIGEDTEKLRRSERINKQNRPSATPTSSSSPDSEPPVTPTSLIPSTSTESPNSTQEPSRRKKK